jgi:hypothetical protein
MLSQACFTTMQYESDVSEQMQPKTLVCCVCLGGLTAMQAEGQSRVTSLVFLALEHATIEYEANVSCARASC